MSGEATRLDQAVFELVGVEGLRTTAAVDEES
jgi:hypothetical protein